MGERIPEPSVDSIEYGAYIMLRNNQLIKVNICGECEITSLGMTALSRYERANDEIRQKATAQRAEEKRRAREQRKNKIHDWCVAIFGAILAGVVVQLIFRLLN